MTGDTGNESEFSSLIPVHLNLRKINWQDVGKGAAIAAKVLRHPELTPQEYVTFLLVNAYFYSDALDKGIKQGHIWLTPKNFKKFSLTEFSIGPAEVLPLHLEDTMELNVPSYVVSQIQKSHGSLEEAVDEAQEMMCMTAPAFIDKKGELLTLRFNDDHVRIFPYVHGLQFETDSASSQLHPKLQ